MEAKSKTAIDQTELDSADVPYVSPEVAAAQAGQRVEMGMSIDESLGDAEVPVLDDEYIFLDDQENPEV